jgi:xanthine dehydrogenase YagR molybdenum-binding subunit
VKEKSMGKLIGKPVNRVDGTQKVTGGARYCAEIPIDNLVHGVLLGSTIANGRVIDIAIQAAEAVPGLLKVFTHRNLPKLQPVEKYPTGTGGQSFMPMQDDRIYCSGQHIALIIAETLEQAQYAASLVQASYTQEPAVSTLLDATRNYPPKESLL